MIRNFRYVVIYVTLFILGFQVGLMAQDSTGCKRAILSAYTRLKDGNKLMKDGVFIEYKTQMYLSKENGFKMGEDSARYIYRNRKFALLSKNKSIYSEDSIQVAIINDRREIMISSRELPKNLDAYKYNFSILQDSIVLTSRYENCRSYRIHKDSCYRGRLVLNKKMQQSTGVNSVTYAVNKSKCTMDTIEIRYNEGMKYDKTIIYFKKIDLNYAKDPFKGSALQFVFDSKGKILDSYATFKIIDTRKSKGLGLEQHHP